MSCSRRVLWALLPGVICWSAGCSKPDADTKPAAPAPPAGQAAAPDANAPPAEPPGFDKLDWKLVDKRKALAENPKLIELEKNDLNAQDPITYAGKAFFAGTSQLYVAQLKHAIDLHKAANDDKLPSFEEFSTMLKQANIKMQGCYRWQVYAYDDQDGTICILENREEKKRIYDAAGIEMTE